MKKHKKWVTTCLAFGIAGTLAGCSTTGAADNTVSSVSNATTVKVNSRTSVNSTTRSDSGNSNTIGTNSTGMTSYKNTRFHFAVEIPSDFIAGSTPADSDGLSWHSPDKKMQITAYGQYNATYNTVQSLLKAYAHNSSSMKITYHQTGENFVLIAGTQRTASGSQEAFSTKTFVGKTYEYTLTITYPQTQKQQYEPIVTAVIQSFIPGPLG